jgi:hypothetical protein
MNANLRLRMVDFPRAMSPPTDTSLRLVECPLFRKEVPREELSRKEESRYSG